MGRKKKIAALCGGIAAAAVIGYAAYVLLTYHRIPDGKETGIEKKAESHVLKEEQSYTISSYNIGFGAYTPEFTFFMDGGKQSVAESPESVVACVKGAGEEIAEISPDFALFQEVDLDATRSHHINEYGMLKEIFPAQDTTFAVNYDSAYLMVPPWEPHGKSLSGMAVFSSYPIESAIRRSLPIQEGFKKLLDLDRCYQVVKIPVENGKYLCLYHVHLSAYGHDDSVRAGQIGMLAADMQAEREKGNYVVCGGDFNHEMREKSLEGEAYSWAHIFPREMLPEGFTVAMDTLTDEQKAYMPQSTRYTDIPYDPETSFQATVDGFLISDNVVCENLEVIDTAYEFSDHNPIVMTFRLEDISE